jgi:hypothetical protein
MGASISMKPWSSKKARMVRLRSARSRSLRPRRRSRSLVFAEALRL